MVGSTSDDHQHHHEPGDDDLDDGAMEAPSHGVSCSICLESITDNEGRSRAKLHCGHQFHLGMLPIARFFILLPIWLSGFRGFVFSAFFVGEMNDSGTVYRALRFSGNSTPILLKFA